MIALLLLTFPVLFTAENSPADNSLLCDKCQAYVAKLRDYIVDGIIDPFETSLLESVCGRLPSTVKEFCNNLVTEEASKIRTTIEDKFEPLAFCIERKLCKESFEADFVF